MKDFRTVTLADQVFERLESDIIQGVYPRGEVLTELRLVEQLNVSRTPIREALRRLEQEHLIADTGKGSVVLGITAEDLVDIMDIRGKIEGLASYYAAKNAAPEGLASLLRRVPLLTACQCSLCLTCLVCRTHGHRVDVGPCLADVGARQRLVLGGRLPSSDRANRLL